MSVDTNKYRKPPTKVPASEVRRGGANELFEEEEAELQQTSPSHNTADPRDSVKAQDAVEETNSTDNNAVVPTADIEDGMSFGDDQQDSEQQEGSENTTDENLFHVVLEQPREPKLEQKWYDDATIDKIEATLKQGDKAPWVCLKFVGKLVHNGVTYYPHFVCSNTLKPGKRLYTFLEELLGEVPANLDIKSLEGMKVRIRIVHEPDDHGNVWDNIGSLAKR